MTEFFNDTFLDQLLEQAQASPRLRMGHDLRNSADDQSQRMFNALIPGTEVPIHRHPTSNETVVILRGRLTEVYYDEKGNETKRYELDPQAGNLGMSIPAGQWHTVEVHEPTVIPEMKNGAYAPVAEADVIKR